MCTLIFSQYNKINFKNNTYFVCTILDHLATNIFEVAILKQNEIGISIKKEHKVCVD